MEPLCISILYRNNFISEVERSLETVEILIAAGQNAVGFQK